MSFFSKITKHIRSLGQKLTAEKIHGLGQKVMRPGHIFGRKVSNSLEKLENVGNAFLPTVQAAVTMAGYPELGGAIQAVKHGIDNLGHYRQNINTLRSLAPH